MNTMEYNGMLVEFTVTTQGGGPGWPEEPLVEIQSLSVSDWKEFASFYGPLGTMPVFGRSVEAMLERIESRDYDAIADAALGSLDYDDEPDCIDDDSYWEDHDIYGGGAYDYDCEPYREEW
jgi:hypothetical protein